MRDKFLDNLGLTYFWGKIQALLNNKVDKEIGKGLSTNDYTGVDKNKLDNIEAGAEVNVQSDWNQSDSSADDYIKNKPTIPTPVTVDQTYNAQSANAQSGVAIEGKKPGEITTGKQYTIDGQIVAAGTGAEAFNDLEDNEASGIYSHAEGGYSKAHGEYSHAEGANTKASGGYSHAEGHNTTASGDYSHTEGQSTTASGLHSHAEGYDTTASGAQAHAEGQNTTASGSHSHAEGYSTNAIGDFSHAEGFVTTAASQYQHVQGKYNVADYSGTYAFIIGNGTGGSSGTRHNAFAIDWDGLIYVNGAATGVDVSAFPSPADINTAITKANAAAPQSTTYTIVQTDTLLDEKLDADAVSSTGTASTGWNNCRLSGGKIQYYNTNTTYSAATTSSSGLMSASDKQKLNGIASGATNVTVDTTLSSTSTNPVQNKAVQAPIARLVDAGAKNMAPVATGSKSGQGYFLNNPNSISKIASGDAVAISFDYELSNGQLSVQLTDSSGSVISSTAVYTPSGTTSGHRDAIVTTSADAYGYNAYFGGSGTATVSNFMICSKAAWDISNTYQPYAPTNRELYEMIGDINTVLEEVL